MNSPQSSTRAHDSARLIRLATATAVRLLETQDGMLFPIAQAVDRADRTTFVGAYYGSAAPDPARALVALRATLRRGPYRSVAVVYGITLGDGTARNALCVEFESLDAAAETIFVPFIITRPWLRAARVVTYAPVGRPGTNFVFRSMP